MDKDSNHDIDDLLGLDEPVEDRNEFSGLPVPSSVVGLDGDLSAFFDNNLMLQFIAQMRSAPAEMMNDAIIGHGYAAVLWRFRAAALSGDIDTTRALKMWLEWAQPYLSKPKDDGERITNPLSESFGARQVK